MRVIVASFRAVPTAIHLTRGLLVALCALAVASCGMFDKLPETVQFNVVEPGIRQVVPLDPELNTSGRFEQYDAETDAWYEAERNAAGVWERTSGGERARENRLERMKESSEAHDASDAVAAAEPSPAPEPTPDPTPAPQPAPKPAPAPKKSPAPAPAPAPEPAAPPVVQAPARLDSRAASLATPSSAVEESPARPAKAPVTAPAPAPASAPAPVQMPAPASYAEPLAPLVSEDRGPKAAGGVQLSSRGNTWVTAVVDGAARKDFYLTSGQSLELAFGQYCLLTVGDADVITLHYNGQPYPMLLRSGQEVRLPPQ